MKPQTNNYRGEVKSIWLHFFIMLYYSITNQDKSQEKLRKKYKSVDKFNKMYYDSNIEKEEVIHFSPYLCGKRLINIDFLVNN